MEIPASLTNQVAHLYYELEALVDANKLRAYTNRLRISENSMVALELASAAFNENRQLLNDASTAIVRSKKVMIQKLASDQGMSNEEIRDLVDAAELNYLDRRSSLNKAVLDINNRMSRINSELIELIEEILQRNSDLLSSNEENLRIFNENDHGLPLLPRKRGASQTFLRLISLNILKSFREPQTTPTYLSRCSQPQTLIVNP